MNKSVSSAGYILRISSGLRMSDEVDHLWFVANRKDMAEGTRFKPPKKSRFSHFILAKPGFFDYAFNAIGKVPSALSVKRWVALEIAV